MQILKNITLYGFTHALVDASCAAIIFSLPGRTGLKADMFMLLVILYNVLAFALQPILGFITDWFKKPSKASAAGCLLTASACMLINYPLLAVSLAGVGNALFHVGGGAVCLSLIPKSAGPAGAYVAPGAMGLFIGAVVAKGGYFNTWIFVIMLILSCICITVTNYPEIKYSPTGYVKSEGFGIILILLLVSISIRALVGLALDLPWKNDTTLLAGLTLSIVFGKALGGIMADRFGWIRTAVTGLVVSAPLLSFGAGNPYIAMAGIFMFNLTMPVTLIAVSNMFPGYTGFAFGLTALGLISGALPAFTGIKPMIGDKYSILIIILMSSIMLYIGLKLYIRGEVMKVKNSGNLLKFMVLLFMFLLFPVTSYSIDVVTPGFLVFGIGLLVIFGIVIIAVIIACIFLIRWIVKKNANK